MPAHHLLTVPVTAAFDDEAAPETNPLLDAEHSLLPARHVVWASATLIAFGIELSKIIEPSCQN